MKNDGLIQQLLYWLTVFSIFLLVISKLQMSMKNNSKYFYISNENMSDIKESIEEYSQNFQRESVANSKIKQSIAEDISYSRTNKLASQSIPEKNLSKKNIRPPTAPAPTLASAAEPIRKVTEKSFHVEQVNQEEDNRPIDFGEIVWDTIQERYYETNKISTDSPDVLYDFYLLQKRTLKPRTLKVIQEEEAKLEKLMPSAKRKMQNRLDFEKMILYKAEDVLYSLQVAAHMRLRDRQLKKNENILNAELKKTEKKKPKNIQQVVNKLYGQSKTAGFSKTNMNSQDLYKLKLTEFGRKLSEAYQNAMREFPQSKVQSLANLHRYWSELYDRQEYGLDWNEDTVEKDLRNYMIGQVIALKIQYQRKIGYSESNGAKLFKFLVQNPGIQGVYIPPHSLEEYAKVYSLHQSEAEQQAEKAQKAAEENQKHWRTRSQVKKFGRPVSATPLTVLAKPKQKKLYGELYTKYGNDKLINTLIVEERVKVARYPFQYGTYDIVDELKAKNRVVPKDKVNFDQAINKMLTKTINNFSGFFSPDRDRVIEMLQSDGLYKNQNWKEQGDTLQEAMLVKSYENDWLRDPIVNYMKKKDKECQFDDDKTLFGKLFKRLNELSEDERETELDILRRIVDTARQLAKRKEGLGDLQKKDQKFYNNQRKLLNIDLLERVKLFLRKDFQMRTGRSQEKLNRRQFLNQTYALFMKNHKDAVKKYFNAVQFTNEIENKECPKLLKYQFYRLCKEINPENYERDEKPKAPNWVPTKQNPDSFNYKSHNQWTKVYKKDKNKQPMDPEPEQRSQSLWGIKKGKDREKLLMTYQDARECYFHPKVKKLT